MLVDISWFPYPCYTCPKFGCHLSSSKFRGHREQLKWITGCQRRSDSQCPGKSSSQRFVCGAMEREFSGHKMSARGIKMCSEEKPVSWGCCQHLAFSLSVHHDPDDFVRSSLTSLEYSRVFNIYSPSGTTPNSVSYHSSLKCYHVILVCSWTYSSVIFCSGQICPWRVQSSSIITW